MPTDNTLGPHIRLWGIPTAELPSPTESAETLAPFLISLLQEAVPFINSAAPGANSTKPDPKLWQHKSDKSHTDSEAKVEVLERVVSGAELDIISARAGTSVTDKLDPETWMCRRSVHTDAAMKGTASWAEFVRCFRDEHAEAEDAFTPNVMRTHEALVWDCGGVEATEGGVVWGSFTLKVVEMRHRIGRPMKDRTFPVLQMVADASGPGNNEKKRDEFLVVSVPVPDFNTAEASLLAKEKGAQIARYVSVERIRKLDDGKIEWLMATASDAGGMLPAWIQNMAMPGVVWKDVPLFLGWIATERGKRNIAKDGVKGKESVGKEKKTARKKDSGVERTGTVVQVGVPQASTTGDTGSNSPQVPEVATAPGLDGVLYGLNGTKETVTMNGDTKHEPAGPAKEVSTSAESK